MRRPRPLSWLAAVEYPSPRKTARIARWEVTKTAGTVSKRTLLVALVGAVIAGVAGPAVVDGGVGLERDIYRVGVAEDSPYHPVVENNTALVAVPPDGDLGEDMDVRVTPDRRTDGWVIVHARTRKGRAAYSEFRSSIRNYNDLQLFYESERLGNGAAAFPVQVDLRYDSRAVARDVGGGGGGGDGGGDDDGGPTGVPDVGGGSALSGTSTGAPGDISPPFPFGSLVLAFLFIIPMNFVIQSYGSTIMDERLNRRGELLLVAPVTRGDIVLGKTLPYFLALGGIVVGITAGITALSPTGATAGALSVAAAVPIALVFLSATFVGAMFARSFKELTFVTLAISVFLTSYAFVPAIFTEITPIALISPLTLVVRDLQGVGVTPGQYVFSTGPFYLTSLVLFGLGAGVYREEDMFTQRSIPLKALDALAAWIRGPRSVGAMTMVLVPFVFVLELLAIAILFVMPVELSLPLLFLTIAVIEEFAKSVHVYAGFEHDRYGRGVRSAITVGLLSGLGFFLAEKATIVIQVVGLQELLLGRSTFPDAAATAPELPVPPELAVVLFFAPLALHAVTASISSVGASRGKATYLGAVTVAVLVHLAYNLGVIVVVG